MDKYFFPFFLLTDFNILAVLLISCPKLVTVGWRVKKLKWISVYVIESRMKLYCVQGNGYERDFLNHSNVYILDVYNAAIYPNDTQAKASIRRCVELKSFTEDNEYLHKVEE